MKKIIFTFFFIVFSPVYSGEKVTFKCDYDKYSDEEGGPHKQKSGDMSMTFVVDTETGKSFMVGNRGTVDVITLKNSKQLLSFLQATDRDNGSYTVGMHILTTIFITSGKSIHSRHVQINGEPSVSQFYGSCVTI